MELWLCYNRPLPDTLWRHGKLSHLLSSQERRAFLQNTRRREKKQESAIGKALQRLAISHYTGLAAQALIIEKSDKGKPFISPATLPLRSKATQFNLSHSNKTVCCAVGKANCLGVDIEMANRRNNLMAIAERYFHLEEYKQLLSLKNESEQNHLFLLLWTLKEATIKALGETIGSMSLDEIPFEIHHQKITPLFSEKKNCHWQFNLYQIGKETMLCTAQGTPRYQTLDNTATLHKIDFKKLTDWKPQDSELLLPSYYS